MIERVDLPFDARHTGAPMARLRLPERSLDRGEVRDAVADARAAGVHHLVATLSAERTADAAALADAGLRLVDVAVDFARPRGEAGSTADGIRLGTAEDADAVVEKCATLFRRSRFYNDPFYRDEEADALHRAWVRNLFGGRAAAVLVAEGDDGPVGFCGMLLDDEASTGRIDLIAGAPAAAGRGLGGRLLRSALAWFDARCERSFVKTQAHNRRACGLYTRHGYAIDSTDLTWALTLEPR